jgi:hypothetical protein
VDTQGLASAARRGLRSTEAGTLEVSASAASGRRTPFVLTHEGRPLLAAPPGLGTGLSASLRVETGEPGGEATRVIVEGALRVATEAEATRFAAFLPGAALCLEPSAVRVEGAGGAVSLAPAEFLLAEPAWKSGEREIREHMNEDHEDSMLRMSRHYFGVEAERAELVAVDPEGLHVRTERGVLYFPFDRCCATHEDVHQATVQLARTARLALAGRGASA